MELKLTPPMTIKFYFILLFAYVSILGCKNEPSSTSPDREENVTPVRIPKFNQDSAFTFIEKQLSFGYRIPGTETSKKCKNWILGKMESYGAVVEEQKFNASFLGKKDVSATNIIAQFNPANKKRILLCAHYDSRMIAEKDADESIQNDPIRGADDGASGTATLIEIGRLLQQTPINLGVDFIFFDAEDQGVNDGDSKTWCLGSQYWANNPHKRKYNAEFGILLDMVAAEGAVFHKEGYSYQYARNYTDKIWKLAQGMGFGDLFQNRVIGGITDDHFYVNSVLGIPTVDIINTSGMTSGKTFGDYHHTHADDINIINKRNLRIVGQVVTAVVYKTYDRSFKKI